MPSPHSAMAPQGWGGGGSSLMCNRLTSMRVTPRSLETDVSSIGLTGRRAGDDLMHRTA
jgi:hypothetical protein